MKDYFSKKVATLFFFMMVAIQMLSYNYIDYLKMEPRSIHSWRQADCVSFALNFYHNRTSFFEPGVSNLGVTGDGKVASDFPLIQYAVAQVWKVTGVNITLFRAVDVAFLILGLFFCFKLFAYWFNENYVLALLTTGILYTSTILSYYGATTLSDIQAFGLSCMGFYYFILWLDQNKFRDLVITVIVFSFAGLFKMSSAFIYAIVVSYFIVRVFFSVHKNKNELCTAKNTLLLLIPFVAWFAWYCHVNLYNQAHNDRFFLIGVLPIWEIPSEKFYSIAVRFLRETLPAALNLYLLATISLITITWLIVYVKSFFKEQYLRLLLPVVCFLSYLILFFEVFEVHDYYFINMMPVLVVIVGLLIKYAVERYAQLFRGYYVTSFLFFVLTVLTLQTSAITNARIGNCDWENPSILMNKQQADHYAWNDWYDRSRYEVLEMISEKTLDSLGITKNTQVMCLGDITINRGLILIDRLGYSSFEVPKEKEDEFIEDKKRTGLKFLIVIDPYFLDKENIKPFLQQKVYEEKGTTIYKL